MFPQHFRRNGDVQWPARSPDLFASTSFVGTLKVQCPQLCLGPQANKHGRNLGDPRRNNAVSTCETFERD